MYGPRAGTQSGRDRQASRACSGDEIRAARSTEMMQSSHTDEGFRLLPSVAD
jgi:hypothetical protein